MPWTFQSVDDMNESRLWAKASKCYEQLKFKDDTNDYWSWAYESECYEQLRAMDDMNNSKS